MRKLCIAIGVILGLLILTGIQSFAQEIHGCVNDKNGNLRIVGDTSECNLRKEKPISWNVEGPQGQSGQDGLPGQDGFHCWDLNENGSCDTSTEDINADGSCDVLDCQGGPKPAGSLVVQDKNDVFLGYLVAIKDIPTVSDPQSKDDLLVFDPSIPAYYWVVNEPEPYIWARDLGRKDFTDQSCELQAYQNTAGFPMQLFYNSATNRYFIVDTTIAPIAGTDTIAHIEPGGECEPGGTTVNWAYPIKYVEFPLADVTLEYPITVRPME